VRVRQWWLVLAMVLLTVAAGAVYLSAGRSVTDGRPVAPLDDAYITFQYARQIARGHPYQYNDGDPPTTGMTSPLYGFLMAGAYLLGFTGERLVAFAVGMGVVWLGLIAWLTYRLTARLMDVDRPGQVWPLTAAALVLLSGSVQWGCFNGMETGLFTVLILAALDTILAQRVGLCALWLGLAGLARPEGLILAVLSWMVALVDGLRRGRFIRWREQVLLSMAVLVGLVPSLVDWVLTGSALSMGLQAKSWWLNVPFSPSPAVHSILFSYQQIVLGFFLGWRSPTPWFVPPGLLVLAVLGWIALGLRRRWAELALTATWFFAGTLSTATLITATWHLGRYQVPFVPPAIAVAAHGLAYLQGRVMRGWQQALLSSVVLFLFASSVCSIPHFVHCYYSAVNTMDRQQLVLADWLRENLPSDARVGVHDTGSLRYLGGRPTYDLIGLTSADAAVTWRHGAGSVFERMEHSPMRPDYFAVYPDVFFIPYLAATDLFAEELFRVDVPDAAGTTSAGPVQGVWRADWSLADSGIRFYQPDILARTVGLWQVDALDVADLGGEAAHQVEWWQDVLRPGFPTEVWQLRYRVLPEREVLDGGRLLTGGIALNVQTEPGQPLWIVARLHAQEAGAVRVEVDGQDVGRWAYPAAPGQWLETLFRVPAEAVTRSRTRVELRVDAHNPDFRHYAPYYFWFLQGEPDVLPVEVRHRVDAVFGGELHLLGFDLPQREWHPGDTVPVTLYWQADEATDRDAKVFLHLYDASGNLGPQSDGWAYHDTRPPYTWWPGEVIIDPRSLTLPADLQTGLYSLEAGLYNPDGSGRLPAYLHGIRQSEERVPLTLIEVTK
jgi:hypothetical protein